MLTSRDRQSMAGIRRRRRRATRTRRMMGSGMQIVRRPRRQRGRRMHYTRSRLQKGEGILGDALKFLGLDFLL